MSANNPATWMSVTNTKEHMSVESSALSSIDPRLSPAGDSIVWMSKHSVACLSAHTRESVSDDTWVSRIDAGMSSD